MKGLRIVFLVVAITVFLGSGGYLLYDYLASEKDQQDLDKLAQIVERSADAADAVEELRQGPGARVKVVRQDRADASGQVASQDRPLADGREDATVSESAASAVSAPEASETPLPGVSAAPAANDADGLATAIQDYLEHRLTVVSQSIDAIRLEIAPASVEVNSPGEGAGDGQGQRQAMSVRARVNGRVGSSSSKQTMENEIGRIVEEYIANDASWTVQSEIIDLDVQVEPAPILTQYEELYELNPDMIGWVRVEGTLLNYPVMQTPDDPEFYLRSNFDKAYSYSGLPFLDARCDLSEPTNNLLIYGHNMKSGKMFGQLPNYESERFWRQHQTIQFDLLNEARTYEVIGMFRSRQFKEGEEGFRYYEYIDMSQMSRFNEFIAEVKKASIVDTGVTASWGDQLLTLSTCSYHADSGTFVVVAKRVG